LAKVLIVDDEKSIRSVLREILEDENYVVDDAANGQEALDKLHDESFDVVLSDVKMPKMDGITLLEKILDEEINTQVIMISAHGTIDTALDATRKGAFDFIEKPPDLNRVLLAIRNALDKKNLVSETRVLRRKVSKKYNIIGKSDAIEDVKNTIAKVAPTDARVMITGPNGSGKELVARWVHEQSLRDKAPFIEVNCAAIPSELIESELFGHEKGSFTSAIKQRIGKFEQASGGTLFLDEVGDMSASAQAKVLRALQEGNITRVGGNKEIKVDVRVLAATNKNLKKEIEKGSFREDLYHRLAVIIIKVPPLVERTVDIPLLSEHFLNEIASEQGNTAKEIDDAAIKSLQKLPWTGNIRELRNVIERLVILGEEPISAKDVASYGGMN